MIIMAVRQTATRRERLVGWGDKGRKKRREGEREKTDSGRRARNGG